jgi:hypothetical protein
MAAHPGVAVLLLALADFLLVFFGSSSGRRKAYLAICFVDIIVSTHLVAGPPPAEFVALLNWFFASSSTTSTATRPVGQV